MLSASMMLLIPIPIIFYLQSLKSIELNNEVLDMPVSNQSIGGNPLAGFKMFFSNPYLLSIGLFIFLYTGISFICLFRIKKLIERF
jgi:AAA family ATP:ADP antiporter